jgi:hypothetical protein
MKKGMRDYHPIVPKCAVCGKPMTAAVFDSALGAYVHPYNCLAPTRRRPKVAT